MSIFHRCSLLFMLGFMSACQEQAHPCDDKLVVLNGTGLIEVTTQWDACVARRASSLAGSQVDVDEIASSALSFCSNHREAYRLAVLSSNEAENEESALQAVDAYQESLFRIAKSEINRARELGCSAQ